ncbi:MAG: hypothetical protein KDD62_05580 [Bdellovibrionales bacterium]|nr:hypothetical protein [Bdellovibrionales bacterium]
MYTVTTFYQFSDLSVSDIESVTTDLYALAQTSSLCGLVIVGHEGVNATVAGDAQTIVALKKLVRAFPGCSDILFKDSFAHERPFRRFKVKERNEIVTLQAPEIVPHGPCGHLSPTEWNEVLDSEDVVLLDTRNTYETRVGMFENAVDPNIGMFSEFKDYVAQSGIPKEKKVLMYCTGGIRCEKAALEMRKQGYENVFQLDGGILNYLAQYPHKKFAGECFVFDHRVAVDQELKPSEKYTLCPHCGNPGACKISCKVCSTDEVVCQGCLDADPAYETCSKNCEHHFRRGSKASRKQITNSHAQLMR